MSVIETLLAETFGVPVDTVKAMDKKGFIDRRAVIRSMIQSDPCRDYKIVRSRYGCPTSFVYTVWNEMARFRFS